MPATRDKWTCVEVMVKMNTSDSSYDGEEAFWIDGRLVDRWATGSHMGQWYSDHFRQYGTDVYQLSGTVDSIPKPFEGFLWRRTDALKINQFELQYYLAHIFENDVKPSDPNIPYNPDTARVEFDNVVLATRYIGPIVPRKKK